jgi:hypothetical protein
MTLAGQRALPAKRLGAAAAKLCIIGLSPRTDGKSYRIKVKERF